MKILLFLAMIMVAGPAHAGFFGGGGNNQALNIAIKANGTNPTGWSRNWCGKFMDSTLRTAGKAGGGNLAIGYAKYGKPSNCRVGAIAVMHGHVGFVTACHDGSTTIISGNHAGKSGHRTVGYGRYRNSRIVAFRMP